MRSVTVAAAQYPIDRFDSLDAYEAINREARRLLTYLGGKDRGDITANLHGIIGRATSRTEEDQTYLASCAGQWVSRAMSVTGWLAPSFRPDNTCPLCAARNSLRIRGITVTEVHASCVACGSVWTPDSIGVLAEHIRWENGELEEATA